MNPKYYDKMSELLDDLIRQRQQEALSYKEYLEQLLALAAQVGKRGSRHRLSAWASNGARRALIDFGLTEEQAVAVDQAVLQHKPDRLDREPDEGTAGHTTPSATCCPMATNALTSCSS